MTFLESLKNMLTPQNKYFTGVLLDKRSESEKQRDFVHEELAGAVAPVYRTKDEILPITQRYYKENQNQTYSCVAHGDTLALGIDNELEGNGYIRLSKMFYYRNRANYPAEGMNGDDAGQIASKKGAPKYETLPNLYSESEANAVVITPAMNQEAFIYKSKSYVNIINHSDIDTLAGMAETGKGVPVFIYASIREWSQIYPDTNDNVNLGNARVRHCITILPKSAFIENGIKYVAVQDSAWFGNYTIRFLSEKFVRSRVYVARYFINLSNDPMPVAEKPKHLFTKTLKVGAQNEEVRWLQKCLQYEGLFPTKIDGKPFAPTGLFAGLTLKAVKDFQMKYASDILDPADLIEPTGIVGIYTNRKLNQIFS